MFYDPDQYVFTNDFSDHYNLIKEELSSVLNIPLKALNEQTWAGERPNYLESSFERNLAWKTYVFKFFGISHLPNRESCPVISRLLDKYPQIVTAEFSLLEPDTHILPHRGYTGELLRAHLGMVIPKGNAAIKVEEDERSWSENKWLVFDDSKIHEAWNKTNEIRIVLMIDFEPNESVQKAKEVCEDVLKRTNDQHMMDIAPNEEWLRWYRNGAFPLKV
ncbi:MAG: aspartyl/asparaginyl beta-hydroxylase domain-containing protein [Flavobacteriales bacterium]|nr:aspartyl/asparaginyl beta-hydroxylase domain-containing protein [Flavobacteriales bacterium]